MVQLCTRLFILQSLFFWALPAGFLPKCDVRDLVLAGGGPCAERPWAESESAFAPLW